MKSFYSSLMILCVALALASCISKEQNGLPQSEPSENALPEDSQADDTWPYSPTDSPLAEFDRKLVVAWKKFESSQPYQLAKPSDRKVTQAARSRMSSNGGRQAIPFLHWWGILGLQKSIDTDVLVAIVVDPGRTDQNRYGLVVLASPASNSGKYKAYWVAKEEDMESWLISPASGGIYIECFGSDGSQETKEIIWHEDSKQFRLG